MMSLRLIGLALCLAFALAGCAKRPATTQATAPPPTARAAEVPPAPAAEPPRAEPPAPPPPAPAPPAPPVEAKPEPAPPPTPAARQETRAFASLDEVAEIYFDFDRSDIRPQDEKILDRNARWLAERPQFVVMIEGHCDERGTNEYNLALGERRANAARDDLVRRGIEAGRITTISYGEERPQCTQRNDDCWSRNRRAHFLVKPR
jgi:peptidoglycan-associated lipoprotein